MRWEDVPNSIERIIKKSNIAEQMIAFKISRYGESGSKILMRDLYETGKIKRSRLNAIKVFVDNFLGKGPIEEKATQKKRKDSK